MQWNVQADEEFAAWLAGLEADVRNEMIAHISILRQHGPQLGRPYVDTVKGSAFANMKELRVQYRGDPWRILFAFDPNRSAILLIGGNKRGDKLWYKEHIQISRRAISAASETTPAVRNPCQFQSKTSSPVCRKRIGKPSRSGQRN